EKPVAEKPMEKPADKPAETASIPAEPRRHAPVQRDKSVAKLAAPAPVPVVVAPATAPAVEAAVAPEERRDANDLARAAIERLRSGNDGAQRPLEAARALEASRNPDAARVPDASRVVTAPALRPLPPPIMVSTPPTESP